MSVDAGREGGYGRYWKGPQFCDFFLGMASLREMACCKIWIWVCIVASCIKSIRIICNYRPGLPIPRVCSWKFCFWKAANSNAHIEKVMASADHIAWQLLVDVLGTWNISGLSLTHNYMELVNQGIDIDWLDEAKRSHHTPFVKDEKKTDWWKDHCWICRLDHKCGSLDQPLLGNL